MVDEFRECLLIVSIKPGDRVGHNEEALDFYKNKREACLSVVLLRIQLPRGSQWDAWMTLRDHWSGQLGEPERRLRPLSHRAEETSSCQRDTERLGICCACLSLRQTYCWSQYILKMKAEQLKVSTVVAHPRVVYKHFWHSHQPLSRWRFLKTYFMSGEPKCFKRLHLALRRILNFSLCPCWHPRWGNIVFAESSICIKRLVQQLEWIVSQGLLSVFCEESLQGCKTTHHSSQSY